MEGRARERKREQFNYSIIETLIWVFSIRMYISWRICLFLLVKQERLETTFLFPINCQRKLRKSR